MMRIGRIMGLIVCTLGIDVQPAAGNRQEWIDVMVEALLTGVVPQVHQARQSCWERSYAGWFW